MTEKAAIMMRPKNTTLGLDYMSASSPSVYACSEGMIVVLIPYVSLVTYRRSASYNSQSRMLLEGEEEREGEVVSRIP